MNVATNIRVWVVGVSLPLLALGLPSLAPSAEPLKAPAAKPDAVGTAACARCHQEQPAAEIDYPRDVLNFVRLDQATIWHKLDAHRQAVTRLFEDRGLKMVQRLAVPAMKGNLADAGHREALRNRLLGMTECLACHAGHSTDAPLAHDAARFGVSCEACHGPASSWFQPHAQSSWRKVSPREKSRLGMTDLRNPVDRAALCLSCHVGDAQDGKIVTHAMYAAGHPELPPIEIGSLLGRLPRHWWELRDKPEFEHRDDFARLNNIRMTDLPLARQTILGAVLALRTNVVLFTDRCQSDAETDFAAFHCADCHQELHADGPRSRQLPPFRTGRPGPPLVPEPLIGMAIDIAEITPDGRIARRQELARLLAAFRDAATDQPFGDPVAVQAASEPLRRMLDQLLAEAVERPVDEPAVQAALAGLLAAATNGSFDFNSARQISWAAQVLIAEQNSSRIPPELRFRPTLSSLTSRADRLDEATRLLFPRSAGLDAMLFLEPTDRPIKFARSLYKPERFVHELDQLRGKLETRD